MPTARNCICCTFQDEDCHFKVQDAKYTFEKCPGEIGEGVVGCRVVCDAISPLHLFLSP